MLERLGCHSVRGGNERLAWRPAKGPPGCGKKCCPHNCCTLDTANYVWNFLCLHILPLCLNYV